MGSADPAMLRPLGDVTAAVTGWHSCCLLPAHPSGSADGNLQGARLQYPSIPFDMSNAAPIHGPIQRRNDKSLRAVCHTCLGVVRCTDAVPGACSSGAALMLRNPSSLT